MTRERTGDGGGRGRPPHGKVPGHGRAGQPGRPRGGRPGGPAVTRGPGPASSWCPSTTARRRRLLPPRAAAPSDSSPHPPMLNRASSGAPRQSAVYRPNLRDVPSEVLTASGWILGTIVLPERQSLVDHLTKSGPFVKLTSVRLPARAQAVPFFALQVAATTLVVPEVETRLEGEAGHAAFTALRVTFLLTDGVLDGKLAVPTNLRLSDHLRLQ